MSDYRNSYEWKNCRLHPLEDFARDLGVRPITVAQHKANIKRERREAWEKLPARLILPTVWVIMHFGFGML
jgi:hypothetical protein